MASAFIAVCSQPFQGPLHLKLHILCSKGVTSHRQVTHGFRGHLHNHRVTGRKKVAQVVGKTADPGGIASLHSNEAYWNKLSHSYILLFTKWRYTMKGNTPPYALKVHMTVFTSYQWQEFLLFSHSHQNWIPAQICDDLTHHRMWWLHLDLTVKDTNTESHINQQVGKENWWHWFIMTDVKVNSCQCYVWPNLCLMFTTEIMQAVD